MLDIFGIKHSKIPSKHTSNVRGNTYLSYKGSKSIAIEDNMPTSYKGGKVSISCKSDNLNVTEVI